jgi:hypothetical protein
MSVLKVETGDYVSFWLWSYRRRGRVISAGWDSARQEYTALILKLSTYYPSGKEWVDLESPYEVNIGCHKILSKIRVRSAVVYKLKGI